MVLFSSGDGRHFSSVPFADAAGEVYGLAVGDFDGDKYPDIAVARTAAPTSVYFSRSGKSGAEISTSESFVPRVPLSEGLPRSGANPLLGVWEGGLASGRSGVSRGIRLRSSEPFQIELTLRSLTVGSTAGHSIFHSTKSVVRCLVTNTVERVDGQSYILRDGAEPCGLAQHSFRITLVGPDSLELQFLAPEPGKPSVVTTTLTRKLPRR
jgi:hypothetical protein